MNCNPNKIDQYILANFITLLLPLNTNEYDIFQIFVTIKFHLRIILTTFATLGYKCSY